MISQVSDLVTAINELRKTIAYCEGRILRKQIAIEELRLGHEIPDMLARVEAPTLASTQPQRNVPIVSTAHVPDSPRNRGGPSLYDMIEGILPQLKGRTFWYSDLKTICVTGFPEHEGKIHGGIYIAVRRLMADGKIRRTTGGFEVPSA